VGCFILGLKEQIKVPLRSHNPDTLVQAYALARNYESYQHKRQQPKTSRVNYRYPYQQQSHAVSIRKGDVDTKQNTATKWEKEKCFKCQEPWVPGHTKVCKFRTQLHIITVDDEGISDTEGEAANTQNEIVEELVDQELQISMHAISGTASVAKTFPLFIIIGNLTLVVLIDSDSSTSFIDPSVIVRTNLHLDNHDPVKVIVANGNVMWTHVVTAGCQYSIEGHNFNIDFRVLDLEGYDVTGSLSLV
jgi:hypothetical protein